MATASRGRRGKGRAGLARDGDGFGMAAWRRRRVHGDDGAMAMSLFIPALKKIKRREEGVRSPTTCRRASTSSSRAWEKDLQRRAPPCSTCRRRKPCREEAQSLQPAEEETCASCEKNHPL